MIKKRIRGYIFLLIFIKYIYNFAHFQRNKAKEIKMDNCKTEKKVQREERRAQSEKSVKNRLEGKEGEIIRSRAKKLGCIAVMFFASWLITGAM